MDGDGFFSKIGRAAKKVFRVAAPIAAVAAAPFTGGASLAALPFVVKQKGPTGTAVETQFAPAFVPPPPPVQAGIFGAANPVLLLVLFTVFGMIALMFFGRR